MLRSGMAMQRFGGSNALLRGPLGLIVLSGLVVVLALLGGLSGSAAADPTYGVMNAEGGIYWRSAPDWNTPEAVAGNGFYPNTIISVHCYQSGAANVPGSADSMWEQATDVGGSGSGSGWINEHFINDGQPINQPSPGVPPCNAPPAPPPPPPPPSSPPPASSGALVFPIFNAEGGIYYRNSPHWADTSATPGVGVYNGDQVELICGALGDPVGPYNDTAWSYVNNLSRPVGDGWVDEHFINDGAPDNAFVSGESMCGSNIPGVSSGGSGSGSGSQSGNSSSGSSGSAPLPEGGSLYYSPFPTSKKGWIEYKGGPGDAFNIHTYAPSPADTTLGSEQWRNGSDCNAYRAIPGGYEVPGGFNGTANGERITTLAGWSLGRIGPIMFLDVGIPWRQQIHYILLFDPGSRSDYYTGVCDKQYPTMSNIVANWLIENPQNKLVVLAGDVTADYQHPVNGYGHAGIQNKLFPAIRDTYVGVGRNIRKQVVVCNYPGMNHGDVWIKFRQYMNVPPITLSTCPKTGHYQHIESWNP